MVDHESFLRRAMRLAMSARGRVEPNPMVGCVLVKDGRVIGEGCHETFGGPHAEPTALAACTESPAGATAYVTLEPCCHLNKKTPPCAPALIKHKIARVVVGCVDPNPAVDGKGLAMLREAGIDVVGPMLEAEARQLLAPFIAKTVFHRPYVTMKWAQSADGKVAGANGQRVQISNKTASGWVHKLRSRSDAILVGIGTVLNDDPMLTPRLGGESRLRQRIVLDCRLRLDAESQLARTADGVEVIVYYTRSGFAEADPQQIRALLAAGVTLREAAEGPDGLISLPAFVQSDRLSDITHLMIEPGPTLAKSVFDAGAADRLWVIRSGKVIDDPTAPAAADIPARYVKAAEVDLDGDVLTEYLDSESDLFYAAVPSADVLV